MPSQAIASSLSTLNMFAARWSRVTNSVFRDSSGGTMEHVQVDGQAVSQFGPCTLAHCLCSRVDAVAACIRGAY